LGVEMMAGIRRTAAGGAEIEIPMLLLHGGDDPLCSPRGSEAFFASLPPGAAPPSQLVIYPGLRHEIFNEPEKEQIFEDLLRWVVALESPLEQAGAATGRR
jgi:alpha-beta hydrolase superfamily lysophospholipase